LPKIIVNYSVHKQSTKNNNQTLQGEPS